ncbi:MAG TPA: hypothetical protein VF137_03425 [Candidatus Dormibacteraeota bacterium]
MTPEEAEARLTEIEHGPTETATAVATGDPATAVRVVRIAGSAEIVGDPSVREAVADGPHVVRREGGTLVIESKPMPSEGYVFGPFHIGTDLHRRLQVRMNPDLPLDAEIQAGSLRVSGLNDSIKAEVQAGSARIDGFQKQLDITVQAGSVTAAGKLTWGASRIACEAGSVRVGLDPASNVTIRAHTTIGRISLPGRDSRASIGGDAVESVVGGGDATLDIESSMGSVVVSV